MDENIMYLIKKIEVIKKHEGEINFTSIDFITYLYVVYYYDSVLFFISRNLTSGVDKINDPNYKIESLYNYYKGKKLLYREIPKMGDIGIRKIKNIPLDNLSPRIKGIFSKEINLHKINKLIINKI